MKFVKTLSRNEMKGIMAGWYSCTCYSGSFGGDEDPEDLGSVSCSDGIEQQECCQAAGHGGTTATIWGV